MNSEDDEGVDDDAFRQSFIDTVWATSVPAQGVEASRAYFAHRRLEIIEADWGDLRWVEQARGEEGALVVASRDNEGKLVAIQETYITPDGQQSSNKPVRQTTRGPADWCRRGHVRFGKPDARHATICEGTEDGLSVRVAGAELVLVALGVGSIGKGKLPGSVKEVTVVRDDDPSGSEADASLWRGVVRLAGQGVEVKVTPRSSALFGKEPALKDANDVLQAHGISGVKALLDAAADKPDELNVDAILEEVAQLTDAAYELARNQLARKLGWRRPVLDKARGVRRAEWAQTADSEHHTAIEDTPGRTR